MLEVDDEAVEDPPAEPPEDDVVEVGDPPTGMVVTAPEITVWQSGSMAGLGPEPLGSCRAGLRWIMRGRLRGSYMMSSASTEDVSMTVLLLLLWG